MTEKSKSKTTPSAKYEFLRETYSLRLLASLMERARPDFYDHEGFPDAARAIFWLREPEGWDEEYKREQKEKAGILFDTFAQMLDPTHDRKNGRSYKYLHWICAQFSGYRHNGKPMLVEDFYKHRDNLKDFESWSARLHEEDKPNQIDDISLSGQNDEDGQKRLNGFRALEDLLMPYQRHRAHKQELRKRRYQMSAEDRQHIKDNTTVFYDGPEGKVLMVHSWQASQHWGSMTKWCITSKDHDYFSTYNPRSPIIFYLPNADAQDFEDHPHYHSFKIAGAGDALWDERDNTIFQRFPSCIKALANAVIDKYQDDLEMSQYLIHYAYINRISNHVYQTPAWVAEVDRVQAERALEQENHPQLEAPTWHQSQNFAFMVNRVKQNIYEIKLASAKLRSNPDFILACLEARSKIDLKGQCGALQFAYIIIDAIHKSKMKEDKDFALKAVSISGDVIHSIDPYLQRDEDVILAAVKTYPHAVANWRPSTPVSWRRDFDTDHEDFKPFLKKAMMVNPKCYSEALAFAGGINPEFHLEDEFYLQMFETHPASVFDFLPWVRQYDVRTQDDPDRQTSGKDLIMRGFEAGGYPSEYFNMFFCEAYAHNDPEIALNYANSKATQIPMLRSRVRYGQHLLVESIKKRPLAFENFCKTLSNEALREIFAYYADQKIDDPKIQKNLRFIDALKGNPDAIVKLDTAYDVIDDACISPFPWPDVSAELKNWPAQRVSAPRP